MKRMKVLLAILLLALTLFLLCGCAEKFTCIQYTDESGGIHFKYVLTYNATASDAEAVRTETAEIMRRYVANKGLEEYAVVKDSVLGEVSLSLDFPSATEYYIAFGYNGREKNEKSDYELYGIYRIYDTEKESYLNERTLDFIRDLRDDPEAALPLVGCKFYYVYGTPYRSVRSNGTVTEKDGIYYHEWELHPGETDRILLRQYALNITLLYIGIILIFILSLAVIFVIIYVNKRKQRKKDAARLRANPELDGFEELPSTDTEE